MRFKSPLLLAAAMVASAAFTACNGEKDYSINGVVSIPSQYPMPDGTMIDIPSPEGEQVYLCDLDGTPIDSCQIQANRFAFTGKVKEDDAYFCILQCMFGNGLVAIEPGEISVFIDLNNTNITGTPSNDCCDAVQFAMTQSQMTVAEAFQAYQDSIMAIDSTATPDMDVVYSIYQTVDAHRIQQMDSIYQANIDNIGGAYAMLMRHSDVESSAELDSCLQQYPERLRNVNVVSAMLEAFRQQEAMMQGSDMFDMDQLGLDDAE